MADGRDDPEIDFDRRRAVSRELVDRLTAEAGFAPGWFERYRPPWLGEPQFTQSQLVAEAEAMARAKALSVARMKADDEAREREFGDWPLDPAEVERRAADAREAEVRDDFDPGCPSCAAMRRTCAFCRWEMAHGDEPPPPVVSAEPTTEAGRRSRAWSEAAAAANRPPGWVPGGLREPCAVCGDRRRVWAAGVLVPCPACNGPAPPYPGMRPGGLAERAYRLIGDQSWRYRRGF